MAVPRPKVLRRLLPQFGSLPLKELVLIRTWRVEKSYLSSDVLHEDVYIPLLHEGLMQGCHTHETKVRYEPHFRPYVEDRLRDEFFQSAKIIATPRSELNFSEANALFSESTSGVMAIGPEAGFTDQEVKMFQDAGFVPAHMGFGILKVETACIAGLAQFQLALGL